MMTLVKWIHEARHCDQSINRPGRDPHCKLLVQAKSEEKRCGYDRCPKSW
jgi:hypothetical protein